jgi:hypothetical protein
VGDRYSKASTARALVLLASGLAAGGAALLCLLIIVIASPFTLAAVTFAAFTLVSGLVATLLAIRARSARKVVGLGCTTLLVGVVLGLALMLILISSAAGKPT